MTKRMMGVEILPGVTVHVSKDAKPETIDALTELAIYVKDFLDEELKEMELFAAYLKSKHRRKVGRPRKVKK